VKFKEVDRAEGWDHTFRNSEAWMILPGVLGFFLLPIVVLSALDLDIVALVFSGSSVALLALIALGMARTRLDISSDGIRLRVFRTRMVPWEGVLGARRIPFGELQIVPAEGGPIRIGSLIGRERIEELTMDMLRKSTDGVPAVLPIGPAEWFVRAVLPCAAMLTVIGVDGALAVAVCLSG
jgi:hypothetical protein